MRAVVQRASRAEVRVAQEPVGKIGAGLLILLGIETSDTDEDIEWLCHKICGLRVFDDENGVMNLSVTDISGDALVVSQFTLHASTRKGMRPSYIRAARPEAAEPMYEKFKDVLSAALGKRAESGVFGAMMDVELVNDGPVTILIDSKNKE